MLINVTPDSSGMRSSEQGRNLGSIQQKATLTPTLRNNGQEAGKELTGARGIPVAEPTAGQRCVFGACKS